MIENPKRNYPAVKFLEHFSRSINLGLGQGKCRRASMGAFANTLLNVLPEQCGLLYSIYDIPVNKMKIYVS